MTGWQFAAFGAGGGALVEMLSLLQSVARWQEARRTRTGRVRVKAPGWSAYVDWRVHIALVILRGGLGACAAALFGVSGQISGAYVAVALGFAAPSVLAQLGGIPQVAAALNQSPASDPGAVGKATTARPERTAVGPDGPTEGGPADEL